MIIQCEQCTTRFRLDDAKVTDKGVKVRCAKCRHVFTVRRDAASPAPETEPRTDFASLLDGQDTASSREVPAPVPEPQQPDPAASLDFGTVQPPPGDEEGSFDFGIPPDSLPEGPGLGGSQTGEFDFSEFEFSDAAEPQPAAPQADSSGIDFGGSLFGDAVAVPAPEDTTENISFDFAMDGFADSMSATISGTSSPAALSDEPFSLGEIDFGDEFTSVAVQQVNPEELKPAQELLFSPLAEEQPRPEASAAADSAPVAEGGQDELPPLSIASRRRQSPLVTALAAVCGIAAVAGLGYYGYSSFSGSDKPAPKDAGRITVRGIQASYVKNNSAGELLVISGEALNEFKGPRASIQVKGMVYGAGGQVLSSKSAYCGNTLSREQLADMPLEKIEAAMANQFGDSLANLEVQPGKAVPFTIVIPHPPAEGKELGVEPGGSTVAAGKQ